MGQLHENTSILLPLKKITGYIYVPGHMEKQELPRCREKLHKMTG